MLSNPQEILAIAIAASFAAGLNVYATVASLGLFSRAGVLQLPPSLHMLDNWWVIGVAVVMFVIEFFADKIPAFDLIWNALHTFIRVPVAVLLTYGATTQLSPSGQIIAALIGGLFALAAHSGKTAVRVAITPSPEPLSNIGLSLGEDVVAIGLTWLATKHPYFSVAIVGVLLLIIALMIRWVVRAMRQLFRGAWQEAENLRRET